MKKNVTFTIDEELIPLLTKVAKKHKMSKSRIVEDYLKVFLPILNKENPKDVITESFNFLGNEVAELFKDIGNK